MCIKGPALLKIDCIDTIFGNTFIAAFVCIYIFKKTF